MKRVARILLVILVIAGVASLLGYLGDAFWMFDLLAHFRLQYALTFLILLAGALVTKRWRIAFAALIGVLSAPALVIGAFGFTPEAAFLAGNLLSFAVSTNYRYKLTLTSVEKRASGWYEEVCAPSRPVRGVAGQ